MVKSINKRSILKNLVKMHSSKEKRSKLSMSESPVMLYPSLYLNLNQLPDLKNKDVGDKVSLVVDATITGHNSSANLEGKKKNSRENFDISVEKIGLVNKK